MLTCDLCFPLGLLCVCLAASAADFEAKPAPYQTTPRPADGETVAASPPCFVYPAAKSHRAYVIEVAQDSTFPVDATLRLTSPYMLAVPTHALEPGRYYWRWRPDGVADEWSAVKMFTVPQDVPTVPFPGIDDLVRRVGTSRPRVQVTRAELSDVRRRALEAFGERWLTDVQRTAERLRAKPLLPEPDFLPSPKDPRRRELYQKTFRTTRPFFREMARAAEDYLLTGHEPSGLEAKRRLLHIVSWDPRGSTRLSHNDEPATEVIRYCPTVFDRVYALLTDDEKRRCVECLMIRMNEMRARWRRRPFEKHPYESHNMGYYLPDMLEASLALAGDAPVEEMLRYTMLQLWSPFYPPYGGEDGGWCEGPNYGGWSGAVFARTYRLVERATGVPVHRRSHLRNFWIYKLYGNPPYFRMSPFGDGHEGRAGGGHTMQMLAALYSLPYAKWYAEQQRPRLGTMDRLLFATNAVDATPPYDLPQGRAFYDVGLATMHTALPDPANNVAVLLRSCPFGSISHAFADQNTFVLDAYGEPLIIASGYYQLYGHPHHAQWTWQTKASNSVLVNGEGQSPRDWYAKGRLVTFKTTVAGDYAVGDATQAYKGRLERFLRRVVFLRPIHTGGNPIVVIRDELAAPRPSTYQFLLHALNEMAVDDSQRRVTISKGDARCRVDYLAPQRVTFDQHDQFTIPPIRKAPDQWHLTASTVEPAPACESLIVIQPYRDGEEARLLALEPESRAGYAGVRMTGENRTVIVLFQTDSEAASTRNGQATSFCLVGQEIRSAVLFEGTELTLGAQTLLQSDVSATLSCSLGGDRRVTSSDAPHGTRLTAELRGRDTWTQGNQPSVAMSGDAPSLAFGALEMPGQEPQAFDVQRHDWVQQTVARARMAGPVGHYKVGLTIANRGDGALPVSLRVGSESVHRTLDTAEAEATLMLPVAGIGQDRAVTVSADESLGGQLVIRRARTQRVYGVNLLPHGTFEHVQGGRPVGWREVSITKGANARLNAVPGARTGKWCLKVTGTEATGGDFGAMLAWPGIEPSEVERKFRMSCWVKTDAQSVAGLQVTSRNWRWWKNTARLKDCEDWTETALDFVLPAGENLTHVRLHMNARETGAELFVDDVSLVELPLEGE